LKISSGKSQENLADMGMLLPPRLRINPDNSVHSIYRKTNSRQIEAYIVRNVHDTGGLQVQQSNT